jgi:hypothetical protein
MEALLTTIVIWISANYNLPPTFDHPRIERVAPLAMAGLRYKGLSSLRDREAFSIQDREMPLGDIREIVSIYNDETKTIYLSDKWTGRSPADISILVHEMVHHLQNKVEIRYECAAEREKLAYEAQDKWLGLFQRTLESEFKINGLALLISTSCVMASGLH